MTELKLVKKQRTPLRKFYKMIITMILAPVKCELESSDH